MLAVTGTMPSAGRTAELITKRTCIGCNHTWEMRTPRTDVCEHGVVKKVPCVACGRTWDEIEAMR